MRHSPGNLVQSRDREHRFLLMPFKTQLVLIDPRTRAKTLLNEEPMLSQQTVSRSRTLERREQPG